MISDIQFILFFITEQLAVYFFAYYIKEIFRIGQIDLFEFFTLYCCFVGLLYWLTTFPIVILWFFIPIPIGILIFNYHTPVKLCSIFLKKPNESVDSLIFSLNVGNNSNRYRVGYVLNDLVYVFDSEVDKWGINIFDIIKHRYKVIPLLHYFIGDHYLILESLEFDTL